VTAWASRDTEVFGLVILVIALKMLFA